MCGTGDEELTSIAQTVDVSSPATITRAIEAMLRPLGHVESIAKRLTDDAKAKSLVSKTRLFARLDRLPEKEFVSYRTGNKDQTTQEQLEEYEAKRNDDMGRAKQLFALGRAASRSSAAGFDKIWLCEPRGSVSSAALLPPGTFNDLYVLIIKSFSLTRRGQLGPCPPPLMVAACSGWEARCVRRVWHLVAGPLALDSGRFSRVPLQCQSQT